MSDETMKDTQGVGVDAEVSHDEITEAPEHDITEASSSAASTAGATSTDDSQTENQTETELQAQLEVARQEAKTNMEGWQRARAEFINYKKRTDREMKLSFERASLDTIAKVLPMIDDFGRALENVPDELKDNAWVNGTSLILKKFDKLLEDYQVEVLDPVGQPFDPRMHEAIGMDDSSDYDSGIVTTTLQRGYVSGEHVLRPALVRVAN
ncbi:MAG: nucleotide exchange factor GrpE [Anaerolineae bacterium]|nr:nucleotide exchange factor GrpE [Anaerolineae bacterium]MCA9889427.1 nucleotide exchange factor GrpE [Anaerolineae bacterium]MCA9892352.1 nucleotide exchange factor GrpE [Anaerolineae bacterium]